MCPQQILGGIILSFMVLVGMLYIFADDMGWKHVVKLWAISMVVTGIIVLGIVLLVNGCPS